MGMYNPKKEDYVIADNVHFYDSKIEREIGFIYGLKINEDDNSGDIIKVPAGRYYDTYTSFYIFKDTLNNVVTPFENNFPESKSYREQYDCWYITKEDGQTQLMYNLPTQSWTTEFKECTFFFTTNAAQTIIDSTSLSSTSAYIKGQTFKIKDLVNNDLKFPCVSFEIENIYDYETTNTVISADVWGIISGQDLSAFNTIPVSAFEERYPTSTVLLSGAAYCTIQANTVIGTQEHKLLTGSYQIVQTPAGIYGMKHYTALNNFAVVDTETLRYYNISDTDLGKYESQVGSYIKSYLSYLQINSGLIGQYFDIEMNKDWIEDWKHGIIPSERGIVTWDTI